MMQTIQIDVKDAYVDKVLTMLDSLQNIMIERVNVLHDKQTFHQDKARLNDTLDDYKTHDSKHFSPIDKPYWDDVRTRLMERHTG
jgi:hypothetical protein